MLLDHHGGFARPMPLPPRGLSIVGSGTRVGDLRVSLPELPLHLEHCLDCREWYDRLIGFIRAGITD